MPFGGGERERWDLALRSMSQAPLVNDFKKARFEFIIFAVVGFAEFL